MYKSNLLNLEGDRLMRNWSRWLRSDGNPFSHCASIEHRYVPEKLTLEESEDRSERGAVIPINPVEGEAMDIALRALPMRTYRFLRMRYYERCSSHELGRVAKIEHNLVDSHTDRCLEAAVRQYETVRAIMKSRPMKIVYREMARIVKSRKLHTIAA